MITEVMMDGIVPAEADQQTSVTIGLDTFFGPASRFDVDLKEWEEHQQPARFDTSLQERAGSVLLDDIARASWQRAEKLDSAPAWSEAGMAALSAGALAEAETAFTTALSIEPHNRRSLLGLARTSKEQGRSDAALSILRSLHSDDPTDAEVTVSLALALMSARDHAGAIAILERDIPQTPRYASWFAVRGAMLIGLREVGRAISDLRKAVKMRPSWVYARNALGIAEAFAGHLDLAERRFREAVRVGPSYAEPVINLVRLLGNQGRWDDALDVIERYWSPETANLQLALHAGDACLGAHNPRGARSWLEAALRQATSAEDVAIASNNLGVAYDRLAKPTEAARMFKLAVEADATDLYVANYARTFLDEGSAERTVEWIVFAERNYQNVIGPQCTQTLATALMQLGRYAEALQIANRLYESANNEVTTSSLLTTLYTDGLRQPEDAIPLAKEGLTKYPGNPVLTNNLAYALLLANRFAEAEVIIEELKAKDLDPDQLTYALATEGLYRLYEGDLREGWQLYERAASIAPRASLRERVKAKRDLEMARAYLRLGKDRAEATRLLRRAAEAPTTARPYTLHASDELRLLRANNESMALTDEN